MSYFIAKTDKNDLINEIEKEFLKDLYNLNVEDLEKVSDSVNIDDSILKRFVNTTNKLITEQVQLQEILNQILPQLSLPVSSAVSSPSSTSGRASPSSTSGRASPSSTSGTASPSSSTALPVKDDIENTATNKVTAEIVESMVTDIAKDKVTNTVSSSTTLPVKDDIENTATNKVTAEIVESMVTDIAKDKVKTSTVDNNTDVLEQNDIEDQIKNSALEGVRYRIELEKERQYAGAYPRKKVGIKNPNNTCYANSAVQMIYSLPFYRKYYIESIFTSPNKVLYDFTYNDEGNPVKKYLKFQTESQHLTEEQKYEKKIEEHLKILNKIFIIFNDTISNLIQIKGKHCPIIINNDILNASDKSQVNNNGRPTQQDVNDYLTDFRKIYIYNDVNFFEEEKFSICNDDEKVPLAANGTTAPSYILALPIVNNQNNTIQKCLEKYLLEDILEEEQKFDKCLDKKRKQELTQIKISDKNRYFLIQLVRFERNYDKNSNNNISNKKMDTVEPNKTLIIDGVKYTLSGVIVHDGKTIESGHYVFIQCNKDGVFATIYNDNAVYIFSESQTYNTDFINQNGYVFTYTRYPVAENNPVNP